LSSCAIRTDPVKAITVANVIIRILMQFHFSSFILQKSPFLSRDDRSCNQAFPSLYSQLSEETSSGSG
jgi:hypothetical protein